MEKVKSIEQLTREYVTLRDTLRRMIDVLVEECRRCPGGYDDIRDKCDCQVQTYLDKILWALG